MDRLETGTEGHRENRVHQLLPDRRRFRPLRPRARASPAWRAVPPPVRIVTYLLEISNVDPIRYGLLFERFLNPERVNPPDIDIDFADDRRARRHRIRPRKIRPRFRRANHHLRHHGRQIRRARRGPRDGPELRRMRPPGQDDPERTEDDAAKRRSKQSPEFKEAYETEEADPRIDRHRARAGGLDAQRLRPRRRRGHRRPAAGQSAPAQEGRGRRASSPNTPWIRWATWAC